jgi:hypothetical protein
MRLEPLVYSRGMSMTSVDDLSTPSDMMKILKQLTRIVRDIEALPDKAGQRFWEDIDHSLRETPAEDLRLESTPSLRTTTALYNLLANMCGPQFVEMVNGATKQYYEDLLAQMREAFGGWDEFIDQKFDEAKAASLEGIPIRSVVLHTINSIGGGSLRRVDRDSKLLKLTDTTTGRGRYFLSKDLIMVEF